MINMLLEYEKVITDEEELRNLLNRSLSRMEEIAKKISNIPQKDMGNFHTYIKYYETLKKNVNFHIGILPEKEIENLKRRANVSYEKFNQAWGHTGRAENDSYN